MGKGGGGGGPSQTTAYQTNLPEYAKPYVMNMLGAAQNQLFTTTGTGEDAQITGFRPYTPYSTDPTQYFAGPSSLQQSVYNEAGQMQTPGQYNVATGLAGAAGAGALGTQGQAQNLMGTALGYGQAGAGYGQAGQLYGAQGAAQAQRAAQQAQRAAGLYGQQGAMYGAQAAGLAPAAQAYGQGAANIGMQGLGYGAQGAGYGQQAANMAGMGFGAGQQYARGVTDPNAIAAYMSPYQQQVTDVAKAAAVREAQMAQQASNLGAARQGTYGGARQALAQAERERNLLSNLSNIQAQGSQAAYDKAIAAQQFGANLGLQGLQAGYSGLGMGLQGAQTGLSGLGTAMQGQQAGLQGLQQAGSLYGQGMQGAQAGLSGVGQQLAAGQLGLQGTAQGIQGAQAGMQGAGVGLSGVGQALGAGQYGLQGLGQATQAASALGQLGTAEQQADLARMGFQQQTGAAQQQYQQNIINQAIQDYATAQQYPYMQLSTMSNLLRGLPMQSMSTQQYQAQPGLGQQALGLAGAYGAYKGMFKEGGEVKSYATGGVASSLEAKMEKMAKTDPKGLERLIAQSTSKEVKDLGREILTGIASAPTGDLGRNLAGGGIIAFANEGQVEDPNMTDEEREDYIKNNAYLQRSRSLANFPGATAEFLRKYNPVTGSAYSEAISNFVNESPEKQAERFRKASARKEQAANPTQEVPAAKTATQRTQEAKERDDKELADAAGQSSKIDYNKAAQILKDAKGDVTAAARNNAGAGEGGTGGRSPYGLNATMTGIGDAYKQVQGLLGTDKPNEQLQAYEDLIAGKQGQLGMRAGEMDRMAMAMGFLKMAQNPRGIAAGALDGFESYLVSSASNKKEQDKIELDFAKARADISKARREEAKGNFELAEKLYDNTQKRLSERMAATKPSEFDRMYNVYAQGEIAAGRKPSFEGYRRAFSGADEDLTRLVKAEAAVKAVKENPANMQLAMSKKPEDKEKYNKIIADTYRRYQIDPETGMPLSSSQAAPAGIQLTAEQSTLLNKYLK